MPLDRPERYNLWPTLVAAQQNQVLD